MTLRKLLRREVSFLTFVADLTLLDFVAMFLCLYGFIYLSGLNTRMLVWLEALQGRTVEPRVNPSEGLIGGAALAVGVLLWLSQRMEVWRRRR
jgi:hypothetical protein